MFFLFSIASAGPATVADESRFELPVSFKPLGCIAKVSDSNTLNGLYERYRGVEMRAKLDALLEFPCDGTKVFYDDTIPMICTGDFLALDQICTILHADGSVRAMVGDSCPAHSLQEALQLQLDRLARCPAVVTIPAMKSAQSQVTSPVPSSPVTRRIGGPVTVEP